MFSRYKFDVLLDIEHLYNIIDENYKKIKFASIEDFKQYINSNKSDLIIDSLLKYKTEENDEENYTKYVGICSSGKEYVYRQKGAYPFAGIVCGRSYRFWILVLSQCFNPYH